MMPVTPGLPWCESLDAVSDGASHPHSLRFKTPDHARAINLHARTLSDELDWCALLVAVAVHFAGAPGGGVSCAQYRLSLYPDLPCDNKSQSRDGAGRVSRVGFENAGS
jgi:hypothetical protein